MLKNPVLKVGDGTKLKEGDVIVIDGEGIQESVIVEDLKNGWYHVEFFKARGFHHARSQVGRQEQRDAMVEGALN